MYNLLNAVTHSHKRHLNTLTTPRNEFCGIVRVDHTEVANTRMIYLICMQNVLNLIAAYYKNNRLDNGVDRIIKNLEAVLIAIGRHSIHIENYKKGDYENGAGVLIFRKEMLLMNGKSVLYTIRPIEKLKFCLKLMLSILISNLVSERLKNNYV